MGAQTVERRELRLEVEAATLAELERVGPAAFKRDVLLQRFTGRAADRATLYRWIAAIIDSGRAGHAVATKVRAVARERASEPAPLPPLSSEATEELGLTVVAGMPKPVGPSDIAAAGGTVAVVECLHESIGLAQVIIAQSRGPDGKSIRLVKTALAASEHLRRCVETTLRVAEAMREINRVDEFHKAVIVEISKASPEIAETLLQRLHHLTVSWEM